MRKRYRFDEIQSGLDKSYDAVFARMQKNLIIAYKNASKQMQAKMEKLLAEWVQKKGDVLNSHLYQMDKYYRVVTQMEQILKKLGVEEESVISQGLREMYEATHDLISHDMNLDVWIDKVAERTILNTVWCQDGLRWSQRIWRDVGELNVKLSQELFNVAVTGGKTPNELVEELMNKNFLRDEIVDDFDKAFRSADRIVRTELNHIQNASCLQTYKDAGLTHFKFLAYEDERTCPECGRLDGKVFRIDDAVVTINQPPIHPNCRCTILGFRPLDAQFSTPVTYKKLF